LEQQLAEHTSQVAALKASAVVTNTNFEGNLKF
jgi:hypothetical protein